MSVNMNSCTLDKQDCGVSCGVSCRVAGEPVGMGVEVSAGSAPGSRK